MPARFRGVLCFGLLLFAPGSWAQQSPSSQSLLIPVKELPKVSLWEPYSFRLQASGGIEPYHWHLIGGSLRRGKKLQSFRALTRPPGETPPVSFTVRPTHS